MNRIKFTLVWFTAVVLGTLSTLALAEDFTIDPEHSFVEFKISHLGISILSGRFNTIAGNFSYDPENPDGSKVTATVETSSVDTNHAERDKHLRSDDFLDVEKFPEARFESTGYKENGDGTATLEGNFTLHGVTQPISITVEQIGAGDDPWGGYRRGFVGLTTIKRSDYGIEYELGPAAEVMQLGFYIEGIRDK